MQTNHLISPLNRLLAVSLMLFTCLNAGAAQVMDGIEGEPLFVDVSLRDLNTIAIEGGKVRRVEARTKNLLSGRADKVTGQALITPLVKSTFGVLVFSQSGRTYTLILKPRDIPAQTIVIREPLTLRMSKTMGNPASSYETQIKRMMQSLAGQRLPNGMEDKTTWKEISLWQGTQFALERTISNQTLIGEQYKLINNSNETLVIEEQEFYLDGVLAVALSNQTVLPGNSAQVYVVKLNEGVR